MLEIEPARLGEKIKKYTYIQPTHEIYQNSKIESSPFRRTNHDKDSEGDKQF